MKPSRKDRRSKKFMYASKTSGAGKLRIMEDDSLIQSMKRGKGYSDKETSLDFSAMERWLAAKINRPWSEVYSEIVEYCGQSKNGLALRQWFKDISNKDVQLIKGVYQNKLGQPWHMGSIRGWFFIQDEILKRVP